MVVENGNFIMRFSDFACLVAVLRTEYLSSENRVASFSLETGFLKLLLKNLKNIALLDYNNRAGQEMEGVINFCCLLSEEII